MAYRKDGWANALTGLGKLGYDKTESTFFDSGRKLTDEELTDMYISGGIAKNIIDKPANDSVRRWFDIEGDDNGSVRTELNRLRLKQKSCEAIKWARLYGGALIVMMTKEGTDLEKPINDKKLKSITELKVYERPRVTIEDTLFSMNQNSINYEDPEFFTVYNINGEPQRVHNSRCLTFHGRKAPIINKTTMYQYTLEDWYWGISEMQHIYDSLKNYSSSEKGVANVMQELLISIFKLRDLASMVSESEETRDDLYRRMDIIQASKSIVNGIFLDAEFEEFERNVADIGGNAAIIDRLMMSVAAVSEIPVDILFGRTPSGLNSTGEFTLTNYYDSIASYQNSSLQFFIKPLLDGISLYKNSGKELEIHWLPLYEPTEKEASETRKTTAETEKIYIDSGVLSPEQVFRMRWSGGKYNSNMDLSDEFPEYEKSNEENQKQTQTTADSIKIRKRFFGKNK